jgi:predicted PolB exonuclease-like 3'-5' exonuclease
MPATSRSISIIIHNAMHHLPVGILNQLLVIDIETVSVVPQLSELSPRLQQLWGKKAALLKNDEALTPEEFFFQRAGIYAEFGKVVCVAVGFFTVNDHGKQAFRVKAFAGNDERALLKDFSVLLEKRLDPRKLRLVAHNGKEFDFPYLCRRMLVNSLPIPAVLQIGGKKPWEVPHIDTLDLWKFGDRKNFTSLDLLAALFDIETSKDGIDGSMVNTVFYKENDLPRIAEYCKKDVIVTAQLFLRMHGLDSIASENIEIV